MNLCRPAFGGSASGSNRLPLGIARQGLLAAFSPSLSMSRPGSGLSMRIQPSAPRSRHLDDIVHRISVGIGTPARIVKQTVKAVTPGGIRRKALETVQSRVVHGTHPPADPALMAELRSRFRPEVERFGEYLGRDLITLWGYEHV